jgi:hypothetical protein
VTVEFQVDWRLAQHLHLHQGGCGGCGAGVWQRAPGVRGATSSR